MAGDSFAAQVQRTALDGAGVQLRADARSWAAQLRGTAELSAATRFAQLSGGKRQFLERPRPEVVTDRGQDRCATPMAASAGTARSGGPGTGPQYTGRHPGLIFTPTHQSGNPHHRSSRLWWADDDGPLLPLQAPD